jgi:hypothetical protein
LKRTELQRSASSNQINSRRKIEAGKSIRQDKDETSNNKAVKNKDVVRVTRSSVSAPISDTVTLQVPGLSDIVAETQDTIDDVSSGIKRLSIGDRTNWHMDGQAKYSDSVGIIPAASSNTLTTIEFCKICKHFNPAHTVSGKFHTR